MKLALTFQTASISAEEAEQTWAVEDGLREQSIAKRQFKISNDPKRNDYQSSLYMDFLNKPDGLSHYERLLWLQRRRFERLWVKCDDCGRWRFLPNIIDRYELPDKWYCKMNSDINIGSCSAPEVPIVLHNEENFIQSRFGAGSVVWAQLSGWPRWPAMVDDCPETEQYYWLDGYSDTPLDETLNHVTHYNVVFFDEYDATRAWIPDQRVESYVVNRNLIERALQNKKYKNRLTAAIEQAEDALKLPLSLRLTKYSFLTRYKGKILSPSKVSKADKKKKRKNVNRQFNELRLPDKDEVSDAKKNERNINEHPLISTPKRSEKIKPKKIFDYEENVKNTDVTSKNYSVFINHLPNNKEDHETGDKTNSWAIDVTVDSPQFG